MTVYCQTLNELPQAEMQKLGRGSRSTYFWEQDPTTGIDVERYNYAWRDFQVDLFITRQPEIASHLEGFLAFASNAARAKNQALSSEFKRRVRATQLVIGYVAGPDYEEPSRFQRLENIVLSICQGTQSLLLWEGKIYDELGALLIG